jgi:hypothetical protein
MKTMPGMSRHPAVRRVSAITPDAIQTIPRRRRNPGGEGRLPTWGCGGGAGGLRRLAIAGMLQRWT